MQGQVVTATLSPGNLATLNHFTSTGSATIDLQGKPRKPVLTSAACSLTLHAAVFAMLLDYNQQGFLPMPCSLSLVPAVQQQNANANGAVTFFAVPQSVAIQVAQSNNLGGVGQTISAPAASFAPLVDSSSGGSQDASPPPAPGNSQFNFPPSQGKGAVFPPEPVVTGLNGTVGGNVTGNGTMYFAPNSTSNSVGTPSGLSRLGIPTLVGLNSAITIPVGQRVSIQLNLKDYVGEVYLLSYYNQ